MATTQIDVHELPSRLAEVVADASAGQDVIIMEGNVPRARLVPLPLRQARILGLHPGAFQMADDFDAPLPEDFWLGKS